MELRRDVFQAIADPTRRAILTLLALQAMTPGAIAEQFDSSRQTISKHIQILTECEPAETAAERTGDSLSPQPAKDERDRRLYRALPQNVGGTFQ